MIWADRKSEWGRLIAYSTLSGITEGCKGYSLVMKLMNSETHSWTHSLASLAICKYIRIISISFPYIMLCNKYMMQNNWISHFCANNTVCYRRVFLFVILYVIKNHQIIYCVADWSTVSWQMLKWLTLPVGGMDFFIILATLAIGRNLSWNKCRIMFSWQQPLNMDELVIL